jgi:predicted metalloprotease with PDZ domain
MFSEASARLQFVRTAAALNVRSGRAWRPLRDTAIDSGPLRDASFAWSTWRRGQDYYLEGAMIWLEADAIIRRLSHDTRSLDDFCRRFLGGTNTGPEVNPYSEDQVVAALDAVQPYDWKRFLHERVDAVATPEPMRALEASGWRLTFADSSSDYDRASEAASKSINLIYSLGFVMKNDGTIQEVGRDGPAGKAGLAPGMKLLGIEGRNFSKETLLDALKSARTSRRPMELLVSWGEKYRVFAVDYHGGMRYPRGERIKTQPDYLSRVLHVKAVD